MTCAICEKHVAKDDATDEHHPLYRSQGGTETVTAHKRCHVLLHSKRGDFKAWGRIGGQVSSLSKQWAFNLKNVRQDTAHEINREFYRMYYAH
jgi:hypothetical protein